MIVSLEKILETFKSLFVSALLYSMLQLVLIPSAWSDPLSAADSLYFGGDILTMHGESPKYVEAVVVDNGKIVFAGDLETAKSFSDKETKIIDLEGRTLMPGFIDSHSHVSIFAQQMAWANLRPSPMGSVATIADIISSLKKNQQAHNLPKDAWLLGMGYDVDYLVEQRHPTAADLDAAFPDTPVIIMHVSGHMVVANSVAMALKGVNADTPNPPGGEIVRLGDGVSPHGLFKETALVVHFLDVLMPSESLDFQSLQLEKALTFYASKGVTTAQEGAGLAVSVAALRFAAAHNRLPIDVVTLVRKESLSDIEKMHPISWGEYQGKLKFGGLKVTLDGSPQGKSAYLTQPYLTQVEGCQHDCTGIAQMSAQQLESAMYNAYKDGVHVFVHANGDAAIDMLIHAHEAILASMPQIEGKDLRTVVIHSQVMRSDQVASYIQYQLLPSFFTNHTYYWGDVHINNLGKDRASFISPMRSSIDGGIHVTNHSDNPVTPIDPLLAVWSAVSRVSVNGTSIGSSQRISVYEALQAATINAAYQYFEEGSKGTIEAGKKADFVILDLNPLKVPIDEIPSINVIQTVKEGASVFSIEQLLSDKA